MKCFSRSTPFRASRLAAAVLAALCLASRGSASTADAPDTDARVRAAIGAALATRVGADITVQADSIVLALTGEVTGELIATPDPSGRIGQAMRFAISGRDAATGTLVRAGQASAVVTV